MTTTDHRRFLINTNELPAGARREFDLRLLHPTEVPFNELTIKNLSNQILDLSTDRMNDIIPAASSVEILDQDFNFINIVNLGTIPNDNIIQITYRKVKMVTIRAEKV